MGISNQAAHQIDQNIGNTAMSRMLDLGNIFELIDHGLNNRPFTDQNPVHQIHRQAVLGVGFQFGDQLHTNRLMKEIKKRFRNITFITINLAKQFANQVRNVFAVIHIGWGQGYIEKFTPIIDHQMQFETKNQSNRESPGSSRISSMPADDRASKGALANAERLFNKLPDFFRLPDTEKRIYRTKKLVAR